MLAVKDVSITIRESKKEIVRNISFDVPDGTVLGLIGESGSGKSMTSKCIMGLLNKRIIGQQGSIQWNGLELLDKRNAKAAKNILGNEICMILQNPMTAFSPVLKIATQLEMGFTLKGRLARQYFYTQLDVLLKKLSLNDTKKILNSYPHELSGGMLQRIMIAITLLKRPELIIADEITTAVDAATEYQILYELENIKKNGVSMIVVTHDFGVAARLCDNVAVMKDGRILEYGRTRMVLSNPQNEYTKTLVSSCILFEGARAC